MRSTEEGGKEWRGGTLHLHHDHHHHHPLRLHSVGTLTAPVTARQHVKHCTNVVSVLGG